MKKRLHFDVLAILFMACTTHLISQDYHSGFKLGASQHDEAQGLVQDEQGNIYLCGNFEGTVDFDPSDEEALLTAVAKYDAYLAKYDRDGNFIRVISIGGSEWIYGRNITLDQDGNIYMTGYFKGIADFDPSSNDFLLDGVELDGYLAKYDSEGNFIWAFDIGNDNNCTASEVGVDDAGDLWLAGTVSGAVDFDPSDNEFILEGHGWQDAYIAKYSQAGELIWAGEFGGENSTFFLPTITFDDSGNLYYTTYVDGQVDLDPGTGTFLAESAGSSDIMLVKLDQSGNFQWGFSLGGTFQDQARDVYYSNGSILLTGFFEESIDFDPSSGEAIFSSEGDYDTYIAAYSLNGEYLWAQVMASTDPATGYTLATDDDYNIYLCGSFWGTVDFDPSSSTNELTAQGGWDMFAAKYDPAGNFQWAVNGGGNDNDYAYNIMLTKDQEDVMVCGKFQGFAEFDHNGAGHLLSSAGGFDAFLVSYSTFPGSYVGEMAEPPLNLNVFPNPAIENSTISFLLKEDGTCFVGIHSLNGQLVKVLAKEHLMAGTHQFDVRLDDMDKGTYVVSVCRGVQCAVKRLLVFKP